jgi:hypothetical protein
MRDGVSQQQRQLEALLPEYAPVDERSMDDLISFAQRYASEIQFYNNEDNPDGDWFDFFQKEIKTDERTDPHFTLFVAFLDLFKVAQDDLNTITERHLNFYYRDVLKMIEKPEVPDQVHIIFELAKHVGTHPIESGTLLKGGKDDTGVERLYKVDNNIVINKAQVGDLKAVFTNKDDVTANLNNDYRIYASPIANSEDGEGAEIEDQELPSWRTFGRISLTGPDREQGEVGFAIASPVLFMAEGQRNVTIDINFPAGSPNLAAKLVDDNNQPLDLNDAFTVLFSGEEEWIAPEEINLTLVTGNTIRIERTVSRDQEAIVAYNQDVLLNPITTKWPVVKILLNTTDSNNSGTYTYKFLRNLKPTSATIKVDVDEVRNLVIQNDFAPLDPGKPFQLWGNQPVISSNFYIGSEEIFQKQLTEVKLNINWFNLPKEVDTLGRKIYRGFANHYLHYGYPSSNPLVNVTAINASQVPRLPGSPLPANTSSIPSEPTAANLRNTLPNEAFKAKISILDKKEWVPVPLTAFNLFTPSGNQPLNDSRIITLNSTQLQNVGRDPELGTFKKLDVKSKKGFLRLELAGHDFGHKDFAAAFAKQVLKAAEADNSDSVPLPKEPYTPTIEELTIDYISEETITFSNDTEASFNNRVEQFFHVEPFGVAEKHKFDLLDSTIYMLPQFNNEGELYIGINLLEPSQTLSLLFQVAEGTANPDLSKQKVKWSYMFNNQWVDFSKFDIISDSTDDLLTSGIITFNVSKTATSNNSLLPAGSHWIRAAVEEESGAISDLISIGAQAAVATFVDNNNDPNHLDEALPAETIAKLKVSDPLVKGLTQPYASFNGVPKEETNTFFVRVSERLRHKKRALTVWDYEHLVLENFPNIYKAKCINHTRFNGSLTDYSEIAPGHVTLILISNVRNKNAVDPLKPKTSLTTLTQVDEFLSSVAPPCVDLHVKNPLYEEIRARFSVKFHPGFDNGFYGNKLNTDVQSFLSPWAFEGGKDVAFGGRIHKSMILNFVEEQEYVDFVTCFEMDHIIINPGDPLDVTVNKNVDEALATTSASILVSNKLHEITTLEVADKCGKCGNEIIPTSQLSTNECPCDTSDAVGIDAAVGATTGTGGTGGTGTGGDDDCNLGVGANGVGNDFIIGAGPTDCIGVGFWDVDEDFEILP